jgi:hypothetical protein
MILFVLRATQLDMNEVHITHFHAFFRGFHPAQAQRLCDPALDTITNQSIQKPRSRRPPVLLRSFTPSLERRCIYVALPWVLGCSRVSPCPPAPSKLWRHTFVLSTAPPGRVESGMTPSFTCICHTC